MKFPLLITPRSATTRLFERNRSRARPPACSLHNVIDSAVKSFSFASKAKPGSRCNDQQVFFPFNPRFTVSRQTVTGSFETYTDFRVRDYLLLIYCFFETSATWKFRLQMSDAILAYSRPIPTFLLYLFYTFWFRTVI